MGATYFAEQAIEKKMNIEAMFTNDIIGGVTTFKTARESQTVRVFSEGVPSNETDQRSEHAAQRRAAKTIRLRASSPDLSRKPPIYIRRNSA